MEITNKYHKSEIINEICRTRVEIKKAKRGIGNAEFRIVNDGSAIDKMWIGIKEEEQKKYNDATQKLENLNEQLMFLKKECSKEEYERLLSEYGVVIAMTEDIDHVENSLYDEQELQKALDETSEMIQKKREELIVAQESMNEDKIIMLSAELEYYENDMRKHSWGEARLESLNSKSNKTK